MAVSDCVLLQLPVALIWEVVGRPTSEALTHKKLLGASSYVSFEQSPETQLRSVNCASGANANG